MLVFGREIEIGKLWLLFRCFRKLNRIKSWGNSLGFGVDDIFDVFMVRLFSEYKYVLGF